ncbi:MAG TPA: lipase maturation factor family protein [Verrucomicrobiae bacterium]|nr:lipase maturation factor family protein [Verrucomicrobiae bacterium]
MPPDDQQKTESAAAPPAQTEQKPLSLPRKPQTYWLTRFMILRMLGIVYAVAFLAAAKQIVPLIGSDGLLPIGLFVDRLREHFGSSWSGFAALPSIFWLNHSDGFMLATAWVGFGLSCVVVAGYANAPIMLVLWALYMSIVHLGQDWYGYGWEIQLLETGFLAVFLCPLLDPRPFPGRAPPFIVVVLFQWLIFRIMLGAGLIKIRGDSCWRDWTALYYHFETQPIPNALSRWFHFLPRGALRAGVGFNHFAELVAPWFVFWPSVARRIAGAIILLFQITLIIGGNLSFLNWLTIVPALACLDDAVWSKLLPRLLVRRAESAALVARPSRPMFVAGWALAVVVGLLSVQPVHNMFSPQQIMNTSFDPLDLVNTYGAFGSVGRERYNVVFEGTDEPLPGPNTQWKAYPYRALPVDCNCCPCQIAPYQPRLDWQMWFAAMSTPERYPWTVHLVWKLLHNDPGALSLFAGNPFPNKPPHYVRATLYRYSFAKPGNSDLAWWTREPLGLWLPPLSADDQRLQRFLVNAGWVDAGKAH